MSYNELAREQQNLNDRELAARMTAYIAPRTPKSDAERAAFDAAVAMQAEYEQSTPVKKRMEAQGIEQFTVNGFSAKIKDTSALFPGGISPDARGVLFSAGLLYRGARLC